MFLREGQICACKSSWASHKKEYFKSYSFRFSCSGQYCSWWRKACGGYRSWFLQYPIFQASCKTVSELIQTYYFWVAGFTGRKRALRGLLYYCPETYPPPCSHREDQIGMSAYVPENFLPGALCKPLIILWKPWEHLSCPCLPWSDKFCPQTIFLN